MTFWEITRKDLILFRRDGRALGMLLAFPLLFIMIIGATTGKLLGWKAENQILKLGFVDRIDYDEIAGENERQELQNIVTASVNRIQRRTGFRIRKLDETEYREFVDGGKVDGKELNAVLIFGPEFQNRLNALNVADVLTTGGGRLAAGLGSLGCRLDTRLKDDSSTRSIIESTLLGDVVDHLQDLVDLADLGAQGCHDLGGFCGCVLDLVDAVDRFVDGLDAVVGCLGHLFG